jgi:hypothetical protein
MSCEGSDRARDEKVCPGDLPRLARKLDPSLDDLLQPFVEELGGQLAAVRTERVRLDQLGPRPDEARMDADDRLGRLQGRLLGTAQPRNGRRQEGSRAPVCHENPIRLEALFQSAHAAPE